LSAGAGWHRHRTEANGTTVTGAVFWRVADGVSDALEISSSGSERGTAIVYRISGANFVEGTAANGSSANSDSPAATASTSGRDYLWVVARCGDAQVVATVPPNSYANLTGLADSTSAGASVSAAYKTSSGDSETPGVWTSVFEQWASFTLAVYQAPQLAGMVLDVDGDPIAADLVIIDRAAAASYSHGEVFAKPASGADGAFALGMRGPLASYSVVVLDPTGLRRDLISTRVEPV
jgi:hypothetical protein